ncbi:MAG TPA: tRNA 5-methoxyuridine(34)/uridine 5-oxyacetic acid(34) synthase CmoB [Thiotrichaceae bacterium]|nr:tRNA 5-methoxyuridine(34)/uridine 5-oxyacetic acid(34) synthase CmoB [Thiotrichaceae bacterium]
MIDFQNLYEQLDTTRLHTWRAALQHQLSTVFTDKPHGKQVEWEAVLDALPALQSKSIKLNSDRVTIGKADAISTEQQKALKQQLKALKPWRKGPFELFGIHIDTEWRSDWKWNRIKQDISPLKDKLVLDIGCGNGYHLWRMLGEQAKMVIGVDPSRLFLAQFTLTKKLIDQTLPIHLLPLKDEDLPNFNNQGFDTVFSMGVLYHRKSPIEHLQRLKGFIKPGGELIIETLVIEGDKNSVLVPEGRYAKMRNVWFLPSVDTLERWLTRLGFIDIKVIDINQTSREEQRKTEWMEYESLADFLDPSNPNLTIEGDPAPLRACLRCKKPA